MSASPKAPVQYASTSRQKVGHRPAARDGGGIDLAAPLQQVTTLLGDRLVPVHELPVRLATVCQVWGMFTVCCAGRVVCRRVRGGRVSRPSGDALRSLLRRPLPTDRPSLNSAQRDVMHKMYVLNVFGNFAVKLIRR